MPKPIKLTQEMRAEVVAEFAEQMKSYTMYDGDIKYEASYVWEGERRASLVFAKEALIKMFAIIQIFNSEVAWHGLVERDPVDDTRFVVTDILVYPQIAASATVESDDGRYANWLLDLGPKLNQLRLQGHSHVKMGTSPSGTDIANQKAFLSQVGDDDYYIFVIANKYCEITAKIFDYKNNRYFENKEIDVSFEGWEEYAMFIEDAKEMVKKKYYTGYGNKYSNSNQVSSYKPAAPKSGKYNYNDYHNDDLKDDFEIVDDGLDDEIWSDGYGYYHNKYGRLAGYDLY